MGGKATCDSLGDSLHQSSKTLANALMSSGNNPSYSPAMRRIKEQAKISLLNSIFEMEKKMADSGILETNDVHMNLQEQMKELSHENEQN